MPAAGLVDMTQLGEIAVDRVQQPERGDVGQPELRKALVLLTPAAREAAAPRRKDLDQTTGDRHHVIAGGDVDERRDETRIELERPGRGPRDAGHPQDAGSVERLTAKQKSKI